METSDLECIFLIDSIFMINIITQALKIKHNKGGSVVQFILKKRVNEKSMSVWTDTV